MSDPSPSKSADRRLDEALEAEIRAALGDESMMNLVAPAGDDGEDGTRLGAIVDIGESPARYGA